MASPGEMASPDSTAVHEKLTCARNLENIYTYTGGTLAPPGGGFTGGTLAPPGGGFAYKY